MLFWSQIKNRNSWFQSTNKSAIKIASSQNTHPSWISYSGESPVLLFSLCRLEIRWSLGAILVERFRYSYISISMMLAFSSKQFWSWSLTWQWLSHTFKTCHLITYYLINYNKKYLLNNYYQLFILILSYKIGSISTK